MPAWRSSRITGSAVVTTRLSSVTMKSATEVIANVQQVLCLFVCDSSLTSSRKKRGQLAVLAALEQPRRPRLGRSSPVAPSRR